MADHAEGVAQNADQSARILIGDTTGSDWLLPQKTAPPAAPKDERKTLMAALPPHVHVMNHLHLCRCYTIKT